MPDFYTYFNNGKVNGRLKFTLSVLFFSVCFLNCSFAEVPRKNKQSDKKQYTKLSRTTSDLNRINNPQINPIISNNSPSIEAYGSLNQEKSSAQVYPIPAMEKLRTIEKPDGSYQVSPTPKFKSTFLNRRAAVNQNGDFVFFTLDKELQENAEKLVKENKAPHVAVVAMEPSTGRILALAEKSSTISDLSLHTGFPAASLFKVVTTAAALDSGKISPYEKVSFRGGTYELSQWNYLPNSKTDKRSMSIGEALGKSCNPVFGRVALNNLTSTVLQKYARSFGFGSAIPFDLALEPSHIDIPSTDYALSRTAAGFGDVQISPLHAVTLMAGLVNNGVAKKPILIDKIISPSGEIKYRSKQENWLRLVPEATASKLVELMVNTTTVGTSRKEFYIKKKSVLGNIRVAGKTGTLRGTNPVGLNNWFIGAPVDNPNIAVAAIVVDPRGVSSKASHLGRVMIQKSLEKN